MQRRSKQILPDIDEPSPKMGPRDPNKDNIMSFVNIIWTTIKVILILFIIFPFIDKIRHKDYFSRAVNIINEFDIGCKPCACPEIAFNKTQCEEERRSSGSGF